VIFRACALWATLAAAAWVPAWAQSAPVHSYKIVKAYPHDPTAFTEGLEFHGGALWESTGLNGSSSIRKVDLATGKVLENHPLSTLYFGEGITFFADRLFQLTYTSGVAFVYDPKTFKQVESFHYSGEGWALTHDSKHLIMDDGSSALRFLDPATFHEDTRLVVREGLRPIANLNELELIEGEIWANIWMKEIVARIDPRSGQVNSWVDFTGLRQEAGCREDCDVLNGIAYDAARKRIFVTGKRWPKLFEIQVAER
jgi:glutaminyl-peptide cyclotransferase